MKSSKAGVPRKPAAVTRSLRINKTVFEALVEEADRKGESVNTLINQQLLGYVRFDLYLRRMGLVKLTIPTFHTLLDFCPADALEKAGRAAGAQAPLALISSMSGEVSAESAIAFLRDSADYNDLFEFGEVIRGERKTITITHELHDKGTAFLRGWVSGLFEAVGMHPKISSTSTAIVFDI